MPDFARDTRGNRHHCFTSLKNSQTPFYKLRGVPGEDRGTSSLLWEQLTQSRQGSPQVDSASQKPREAWEYLGPRQGGVRRAVLPSLPWCDACMPVFFLSLEFFFTGEDKYFTKAPTLQGSPYPLPGADSRTEHLDMYMSSGPQLQHSRHGPYYPSRRGRMIIGRTPYRSAWTLSSTAPVVHRQTHRSCTGGHCGTDRCLCNLVME